jgi:hypothetical protein
MENGMDRLIVTTAVLLLAGLSAGHARGGMHGMAQLSAPANPTVPPSLTPDSRLTGSAPLPPHRQPTRGDVTSIPGSVWQPDPEDKKVDRVIGSICRGC